MNEVEDCTQLFFKINKLILSLYGFEAEDTIPNFIINLYRFVMRQQFQERIDTQDLLKEKLRTSEEKMRTVLAAMTDIVLILNTQESQLEYIEILPTNPSRLYADGTDLINQTVEQIYQDKTWFKKVQQVLDTQQTLNFDYSLPLKEGETWFSASISPITDSSVLWVARNISDRKQILAALQESEARLKLALEAAQMGTWDWNILTNDVAYSDKLESIFGLPRGSDYLNYEAFIDSVYPPDRESVSTAIARALEKGADYSLEFRVVVADGTLRWLGNKGQVHRDKTGRPYRMIGVARDITSHKIAEEQLRSKEALLRSMASSSPLAFYVVDNCTDTILYFNHRFCKIWGIEHLEGQMQRGELKNNDIVLDCLPKLMDIPAFAESCKPLQNIKNRAIIEDEISFVDSNTIRRFSTQVRDDEDNYIGHLYIFEDITDRKRTDLALQQSLLQLREQAAKLEQTLWQLKETQAKLIQTEKMSSLCQLVAGLAHEINNPVNFIYGNIQYIKECVQDLLILINLYQQQYPHPIDIIQIRTEEIDLEFIINDLPKVFNSMKAGAERIYQTVLALRNFSHLDEAEVKKVDLHAGIDNTLLILNNRLLAGITVIKQYGDLPKVECYAAQINQVFMNILNNAIDSLLEQTDLINKQIIIQTETITPLLVQVRIIDNGSGIEPEILDKIFDPFFTTKDVGKGTGLGLTTCYQIIEKHQGKIEVNSQVGEGTEFVITIPLDQVYLNNHS